MKFVYKKIWLLDNETWVTFVICNNDEWKPLAFNTNDYWMLLNDKEFNELKTRYGI